jgi:4-amino-4-deoxy-L-arabinose transferase-like glycosyltransferase
MPRLPGAFQKSGSFINRHSGVWMLIFAAVFFTGGVCTLPAYGMTWDEGLGNFFFGERYLFYLQTFNGKFLDFKADLASLQGFPLHLYLSPLREFPHEFPAFFDTISAASMHLLAYRLNWFDPVDAFHLPTVLAAALLLLAVYHFSARRLGKTAAWFGVLLLGVFPRFWADMHFNVKDIPEMVFFSLAIMGFAAWYEKPGWWKALITGLAFGAAISIKANGWFVPVVLLLSLLPWSFRLDDWLQPIRHLLRHAGGLLLMGASGALLLFGSWPYLYEDPLRLRNYLNYILSQGDRSSTGGWSWQPFKITAAVLPEILLVFLLAGVGIAIYRAAARRSFLHRLLLVWCLLPVVRISLPGMVNFDGIRHFVEFLPAACILAGLGMQTLIGWIGEKGALHRTIAAAALVVWLGVFTFMTWQVYGPFQHTYFNRLSGGLGNAAAKFGQAEATDYWGATYRQGMQWLSANAAPGAKIYVPAARWLVELPAPLWLRSDLTLLIEDITPDPETVNMPIYVLYITRPESENEITQYCEEKLEPAYQISTDGVVLLKIYRLDRFEGGQAWQLPS